MPDHLGTLSQFEIDRIISRLVELDIKRGRSLICAVCSHQKWTVQPQILALQAMSHFGIPTTARQARPVVMVSCSNCGNSHFFEASKLGIEFPPIPQNAFAGIANLPMKNPPKPPEGTDG